MEQTLAELRERHATFNPVEGRSLADGDFAQVSLDGNPKAEQQSAGEKAGEGQPVHMDEVLVEIAGKNTMPEFTEHLRGTGPGDERTFDVNYPDDTQDKRLAGKTFTYVVKVADSVDGAPHFKWARRLSQQQSAPPISTKKSKHT